MSNVLNKDHVTWEIGVICAFTWSEKNNFVVLIRSNKVIFLEVICVIEETVFQISAFKKGVLQNIGR
jgi:hypothetical protein